MIKLLNLFRIGEIFLAKGKILCYNVKRNLRVNLWGCLKMSKECYICGKSKVAGNQVSHSHIATKRTFGANLQKKPVEIDGKLTKVNICTRCLKTMKNSEN